MVDGELNVWLIEVPWRQVRGVFPHRGKGACVGCVNESFPCSFIFFSLKNRDQVELMFACRTGFFYEGVNHFEVLMALQSSEAVMISIRSPPTFRYIVSGCLQVSTTRCQLNFCGKIDTTRMDSEIVYETKPVSSCACSPLPRTTLPYLCSSTHQSTSPGISYRGRHFADRLYGAQANIYHAH